MRDDGRLWTLGALAAVAAAGLARRGSSALRPLPPVYYHGTPYEKAAEGIRRQGIKPPDLSQRTGPLRPVEGRVYLSPTPELAVIHALGGVFMGHPIPDEFVGDEYGTLFVVPTETLGVLHPDEDDIGRMISEREPAWLRKLADTVLDGVMPESPEPVSLVSWLRWENIPQKTRLAWRPGYRMRPYLVPGSEDWDLFTDWLRDHPEHDDPDWWQTAPQTLLELIDEGEYTAWAEGGKLLLPYLSPVQQTILIRKGTNVAHQGPIRPSACWRLRKRDSYKLLPDASNVFEVATPCP